MANASAAARKIKPFVAWDDKETCHTAEGSDARSSDYQTNKLLDLQCDELGTESEETDSAITEQSGLREDPLSIGVMQKQCQWFSDTQEAVDANVTSTFSQDKRSTVPSSKRIRKQVKLRRKKSSCMVHSVSDENQDPDYSAGQSPSSTTVCSVRPTVVSFCLPLGCIPSEVIAEVPAEITSSTPQERSLVPLDKGCEVDPWINNICAEASTLMNPAQPGMVSVPGLSALTVVHDLNEDTALENNLHGNTVLKMFLQNQRVVYRRNAICEELEMITGIVKINGARFSLWHLRAELQNIKNCS